MKNYFASALVLLTFLPTVAFGQAQGLFCTAGIHPDGYIDLTALPPAPHFAGAGSTSAPFTVTLPVTGVSGLTVQVTIPALRGSTNGPIYNVANGSLQFNGEAIAGYQLMLLFSKPVTAISAMGYAFGRQSTFFIATDPPGNIPATFDNSVATFNLAANIYSQPLQQVNLSSTLGGFTMAYLYASGDPFAVTAVANVRVQSGPASSQSLVPTQGLQQWLSSDTIPPQLVPTGNWPDSSGNGHDATQTPPGVPPAPVQGDGNNCQPSYAFAGNNYFNFDLPIAGWQQMTVFLVAKTTVNPPAGSYASFAAAMLWNENALWGNTFVSPYQTSEAFRFGTQQVNNQPIYNRPATIGQDFTISRAVHDGATDSLYVNGLLVLRQGNKSPVLAGTTGAGYLGRGINNTYYNGEISEILVYNRVLSTEEAASVEFYLRNKFGTN